MLLLLLDYSSQHAIVIDLSMTCCMFNVPVSGAQAPLCPPEKVTDVLFV